MASLSTCKKRIISSVYIVTGAVFLWIFFSFPGTALAALLGLFVLGVSLTMAFDLLWRLWQNCQLKIWQKRRRKNRHPPQEPGDMTWIAFGIFYFVTAPYRAIMDKIEGPVNLATGETHSMRDVADILSEISGRRGVTWDHTKPVGQVWRSYNCRKLFSAGFKSRYALREGLTETYAWYAANAASARQ